MLFDLGDLSVKSTLGDGSTLLERQLRLGKRCLVVSHELVTLLAQALDFLGLLTLESIGCPSWNRLFCFDRLVQVVNAVPQRRPGRLEDGFELSFGIRDEVFAVPLHLVDFANQLSQIRRWLVSPPTALLWSDPLLHVVQLRHLLKLSVQIANDLVHWLLAWRRILTVAAHGVHRLSSGDILEHLLQRLMHAVDDLLGIRDAELNQVTLDHFGKPPELRRLTFVGHLGSGNVTLRLQFLPCLAQSGSRSDRNVAFDHSLELGHELTKRVDASLNEALDHFLAVLSHLLVFGLLERCRVVSLAEDVDELVDEAFNLLDRSICCGVADRLTNFLLGVVDTLLGSEFTCEVILFLYLLGEITFEFSDLVCQFPHFLQLRFA